MINQNKLWLSNAAPASAAAATAWGVGAIATACADPSVDGPPEKGSDPALSAAAGANGAEAVVGAGAEGDGLALSETVGPGVGGGVGGSGGNVGSGVGVGGGGGGSVGGGVGCGVGEGDGWCFAAMAGVALAAQTLPALTTPASTPHVAMTMSAPVSASPRRRRTMPSPCLLPGISSAKNTGRRRKRTDREVAVAQTRLAYHYQHA